MKVFTWLHDDVNFLIEIFCMEMFQYLSNIDDLENVPKENNNNNNNNHNNNNNNNNNISMLQPHDVKAFVSLLYKPNHE